MPRILVIGYSQTGQLRAGLDSLVSGLDPSVFDVVSCDIQPVHEYPFPWSVGEFFDVFPESVLGRAPEIKPLPFEPDQRFDLVVLGYTVWFLAPSLPVQGFFRSPYAAVLRDTSVVTLIACRNMWHAASETMKTMIGEAGGRLIDSVVITDQGSTAASFVTTPRWMFTGRKDSLWGIFPPAGVSNGDILELSRVGRLISENGARIECGETRSILAGKVPVTVEEKLIIPELIGSRSFPVWARLIRAVGEPGTARARFATWLFVCYLVAAILILVPLSIIARILLYPVVSRRLRAHADRLARPTGRTFAEDGIRPDEPGTECLRQGNGRVPAERTRRQP